MNCEQAKPLIQPYADGELDAGRILELEQHLRDCPACAPLWRNLQTLKKAVRQDALFFTAPAELERRLRAELRSQAKGRAEKKFWNWNWLTAATTGLAAVCLALLIALTLTRNSRIPLEDEIVSSHIRSLMANHALDVASTDQHTVKPWFDGKLDFAPPVKDLAPQGFSLLGGRLDYVGGHDVAALVFQCHKHVINLFIWPAEPTEPKPKPEPPLQGYNVIHWSQSEMSLWAVSDLNATELMQFALAFESAGPSPTKAP
jgi:anti-sigma factor RsiW